MSLSTQWNKLNSKLRDPLVLRWARWFATTTAVAAVGSLLLPICRRYPEWLHSWFATQPSWQGVLACLFLSSTFVFVVFNLLSPRVSHLQSGSTCLHPPVWMGWAVGALIVCILDLAFGLGPRDFHASAWQWLLYAVGAIMIVAGFRWITRDGQFGVEPLIDPKQVSPKELIENPDTLEQWLRAESPSEVDLLSNLPVARRLASYALRQGGTIGIVGEFGSGKTTLINWLKAEVRSIRTPEDPEIWFCDLTCWGFEDSTSAIQHILSKAIATVNRHADCFSIRHLPEAYRKTFSTGGDWLRNLIDLVIGSADPMDQFKHLTEILAAVNARLIVVVEELERTNNSRFDRQEVLALLYRLKSLDRVSFVLSGGWTSTTDMEFAKLCDHIEVMRQLNADQVAGIIEAVRTRCLKKRRFGLASADENPWHPVHYAIANRLNHMSLDDAATQLLRTPRGLKHALSRTLRAWDKLCGEINFDHLLGINMLRHAAAEAFDFVLRRWGRLSDDPRGWSTDQERIPALREQIKAEWEKVCRNATWHDRAAKTLIVFLLPSAGEYLLEEGTTRHYLQQGLNDPRYWHRAIIEEIGSNESRDQDVLNDLRQWIDTRRSDSPLVLHLIAGGDYVAVWENLADTQFQPPGTVLLQLASQVIASFCTPRGVAISEMNVHPAFLALWRRANRIVLRGSESADWLKNQLAEAMPKSLSLVNDLYYYWGSLRHGIIRPEDRSLVQNYIHSLARDQWQNGEMLIRVAHPEQRYDFYQLVFPPGDSEDGRSPHRGVEHWTWLGPPLLEALQRDTPFIAPKIASLVSRRVDGEHPGMYTHQTSLELLTGLFNASSERVMQLIARARDGSTGENREFLDQIVRSYRQDGLA